MTWFWWWATLVLALTFWAAFAAYVLWFVGRRR
jgi:hypothetical protein